MSNKGFPNSFTGDNQGRFSRNYSSNTNDTGAIMQQQARFRRSAWKETKEQNLQIQKSVWDYLICFFSCGLQNNSKKIIRKPALSKISFMSFITLSLATCLQLPIGYYCQSELIKISGIFLFINIFSLTLTLSTSISILDKTLQPKSVSLRRSEILAKSMEYIALIFVSLLLLAYTLISNKKYTQIFTEDGFGYLGISLCLIISAAKMICFTNNDFLIESKQDESTKFNKNDSNQNIPDNDYQVLIAENKDRFILGENMT